MTRPNPIGIISMFYARPFGRVHFDTFTRMKQAGCDFVELLVPEPGELDLRETRSVLADHGLGVVLAARVNLTRDLASDDPVAHQAGVTYLQSCAGIAQELGATIVGGGGFGPPPSIQQQQASSERFAKMQQTQESVFRRNLNADEYDAVAKLRSEMQSQKRVTVYKLDAAGELERATLTIGISDGENAQIIRGAEEGDVFVVRANAADKASGQTQARS
jgi:Fe2+ transport system protein FeoA